MRYTCPRCESTDTALTGTTEGWDATGPHGIQIKKSSYRCRQCGERWSERADVTASTE